MVPINELLLIMISLLLVSNWRSDILTDLVPPAIMLVPFPLYACLEVDWFLRLPRFLVAALSIWCTPADHINLFPCRPGLL